MAKKKGKLNGSEGTEYAKELGKSILPKVVGWGVGIGAGYFLLIKPILTATGVIKTPEAKKAEEVTAQNATGVNSPFNPRYYTTVPGATVLTSASANALSKALHDAIGTLTDDENIIYGVFRQLKAKTQVSFLASVFYKVYGEDLYNYLERNLKDSEIAVVNGIVNNLS